MDNQDAKQNARLNRPIFVLILFLACASLLIPYALKGELSKFDGWLTGQWYVTLLCLFASGLLLGAIRPSRTLHLALKLGCTLAIANALVVLWHCPG